MHASGVIAPMRLARFAAVLCCLLLAGGCAGSYKARDAQALLDRIAHGTDVDVGHAIYGFGQAPPPARKVLIGMLQPLRAPSADGKLSIEAAHTEGEFTLLIVRVSWPLRNSPNGRQPVIICHRAGEPQVVGYVLPFNDLMPRFSSADLASMAALSRWWMQTGALQR